MTDNDGGGELGITHSVFLSHTKQNDNTAHSLPYIRIYSLVYL